MPVIAKKRLTKGFPLLPCEKSAVFCGISFRKIRGLCSIIALASTANILQLVPLASVFEGVVSKAAPFVMLDNSRQYTYNYTHKDIHIYTYTNEEETRKWRPV